MKLTLGKKILNTLRQIGIQGFTIIEFDDNLGPQPKFVYSRHAKLIRRILKDRIFSSKLSILAKYAYEAKLMDDSRIIIETFESKGTRIKTNYIVVQVSENANYNAVRSFLKRIKKTLDGSYTLSKRHIETVIKSAL